jgi:hypothetical protein
MVKERFGDALVEMPPPEIVKAVFQRLTATDPKTGVTRHMEWSDIGKYGRIRSSPGDYKGSWHQEHELLPLP